MLRLSVNFIPLLRHTDVSLVFRATSLLKDSNLFPKVGMRPDTLASPAAASLKLSVFSKMTQRTFVVMYERGLVGVPTPP